MAADAGNGATPKTAGDRTVSLVVGPDEAGGRLDAVLGRHDELLSRSKVAGLIERGLVTVDGMVKPKSFRVAAGQALRVVIPVSPVELASEDRPVPVLFEDDWLLVVDKPAGMTVHPAKGHPTGTLVNALLGHGLAGGDDLRPGIVHRLDRDTSGLLIVAKSPRSHRLLSDMLQRRDIDRRYIALVHGDVTASSGTIEAAVGRDPTRRKSMSIGGVAARAARTHFCVLERFGVFTLVEAHLDTGRTHQIRVHFLAVGHPVAGDPVYARRDPLSVGRQFLHSHRLGFVHPLTGEPLDLTSPLPDDLRVVLERLR